MIFLYVSQDFVILTDRTETENMLDGCNGIWINKSCRAAYTKRTCGPWDISTLEACGMEGLLDAQPCRRGP